MMLPEGVISADFSIGVWREVGISVVNSQLP